MQFAYIFAFPFIITEVNGMTFDDVSLLTIPGLVIYRGADGFLARTDRRTGWTAPTHD